MQNLHKPSTNSWSLTMKAFAVYVLCLVTLIKAQYDRHVVQVSEGTLLGIQKRTAAGFRHVEFAGIPYAEPPIGPLRFAPPVEKAAWEGVRDASVEGPMCPQPCSTGVCGDEDCLYLNVYTSKLPEEDGPPLKTMVYFHGGGFRTGSAQRSTTGPDFFLEKGVIVVLLQYRLGALGFLSLKNDLIPGNMGLKDQNLALKWIRKNIGAFGGDENDITIFGHSSGASSVHFHILSPLSEGLFHRAIAQSGSALSPGVIAKDPRQRAISLIEALGYNKKIIDVEIVEFLRNAKVYDLVQRANESLCSEDRHRINLYEFVPCVEPDVPGAFLTEDPSVLVEEGRYNNVPYLTGVTSAEANFLISAGGALSTEHQLKLFDKLFVDIVAPEIRLPTEKAREAAAWMVRKFYFGARKITEVESEAIVQMFSDLFINEGVETVVRSNAAVSTKPLYYYRFSFKGSLNLLKDVPGATHSDELQYMFCSDSVPDVDPKSLEGITRRRLITLWTNFAIYENATPTLDSLITAPWPEYTEKRPAFLEIGTKLVSGLGMSSIRQNFLASIFSHFF